MVKGKRNGLTFTECSVKICRFLCFQRHFENEATTMQRNQSAHTAVTRAITLKRLFAFDFVSRIIQQYSLSLRRIIQFSVIASVLSNSVVKICFDVGTILFQLLRLHELR